LRGFSCGIFWRTFVRLNINYVQIMFKSTVGLQYILSRTGYYWWQRHPRDEKPNILGQKVKCAFATSVRQQNFLRSFFAGGNIWICWAWFGRMMNKNWLFSRTNSEMVRSAGRRASVSTMTTSWMSFRSRMPGMILSRQRSISPASKWSWGYCGGRWT